MDAYSFHADEDCLDQTYQDMSAAYHRVFKRCGLEAYAVEADPGAIGGSGSHEFMVAAEGETQFFLPRALVMLPMSRPQKPHLHAPAWNAPSSARLVRQEQH